MSMTKSRMARAAALPLLGVVMVLAMMGQARSAREAAAAKSAAQTEAAASARGPIAAEGHLVTYPGAEIVVSSEVKGKLVGLAAVTGTHVRKGELLAEIKADDIRAALVEARARVIQAEADIKLYSRMAERTQRLLDEKLDSQQSLDKSQRDRDAALARRDEAAAEVLRLEAVLEKTRLVSPIDGVVLDRFKDPGEILDEGTPVLHIADLGRVRLETEVDEYDAGRLKIGTSVTAIADGYPGVTWRGHVEEIPDAVVPRGLKSQDPGRPTDTGVLKVKVAFDQPTPLKLGQRVQVTIHP